MKRYAWYGLAALILFATVMGLTMVLYHPSVTPVLAPEPTRLAPPAQMSPTVSPTTAVTASTSAAPSASLTKSLPTLGIDVAQSRPVAFKVPVVGLDIKVSTASCPIDKDGVVRPDYQNQACIDMRSSKPYQLPGSSSTDLTALFGHTCQTCVGAVAFNPLYDWHTSQFTVKQGDLAYIQTEASGGDWLAYEAVVFATPDKAIPSANTTAKPDLGSLAYSEAVWGTAPRPNWLVTVGCQQSATVGGKSVNNIAIGWKFVGVVGDTSWMTIDG